MKDIKIKDYLGTEVEGKWNGKIYNSKIEGTKRIYINNTEVLIKNEDVEKISNINESIKQVIDNYFTKLNTQEREELLTYLSSNLQKEYKKEYNLYVNNFKDNSITYLLVEEFKKLDFNDKVDCFKNLKADYFNQKNLEETGNWHN